MSLKQLQQTIRPVWNSKPGTEKLMAKILAGLAALAIGNSGFQFAAVTLGTLHGMNGL